MAIQTLGNLVILCCARLRGVSDPRRRKSNARRDLADTLAYWKETTGYGRAIAAPQIGALLRSHFCNCGADLWPLTILKSPNAAKKNRGLGRLLSFLSFYASGAASRIVVRYRDLGGEWRNPGGRTKSLELLQHESIISMEYSPWMASRTFAPCAHAKNSRKAPRSKPVCHGNLKRESSAVKKIKWVLSLTPQ